MMIGIVSTHPVIKHRKSMEILQQKKMSIPITTCIKKGDISLCGLGMPDDVSHMIFGGSLLLILLVDHRSPYPNFNFSGGTIGTLKLGRLISDPNVIVRSAKPHLRKSRESDSESSGYRFRSMEKPISVPINWDIWSILVRHVSWFQHAISHDNVMIVMVWSYEAANKCQPGNGAWEAIWCLWLGGLPIHQTHKSSPVGCSTLCHCHGQYPPICTNKQNGQPFAVQLDLFWNHGILSTSDLLRSPGH